MLETQTEHFDASKVNTIKGYVFKTESVFVLMILLLDSGITVEDVDFDGPVLQILYTNNAISK